MYFHCFSRSHNDVVKRGPHTAQNSRVADEPQAGSPTESAASSSNKLECRQAAQRLSWGEVEALTGNFSTNVIGEGGFSTVYVGRLPAESSPTLAAFKVQHCSERLFRGFLQELQVLMRIRHQNVVRLLGYSDNHLDQGVLVLEYVRNGTLHDRLHSDGDHLTASISLTWTQRMSILFQIASAVDYLHDGCDLQIVHGDLTASNVLLDDRLNPKLCDFGSARMGFSAAVKPVAAGNLVGSPGYVDPHYLRTGIVSKKSDVYSFGVLVLEMVTGIPAVGSGEERMLTAVMRDGGWDRLGVMVDPRVGTDFDAGEVGVMGEIAGRCVGDRPGLRPSMWEIIRIMRERINIVEDY